MNKRIKEIIVRYDDKQSFIYGNTLGEVVGELVRCAECKHKQQCRKAVEHITHEPTSVTIGYKSVEWCSYGEREGE
jgi:hypothetical protein